MTPTVRPGWSVLVEPVEPGRVRRGELVVLEGQSSVCHRLVGGFGLARWRWIIHRGDGSRWYEVAHARELRWRVVGLRSPTGSVRKVGPADRGIKGVVVGSMVLGLFGVLEAVGRKVLGGKRKA